MPGWTLAIDFGTTNTAAAYCRDGERPVPVRLSDRADQMPSAVYWSDAGPRVGTEAVRSARLRPDLFERAPKRRIGEGSIQLGDADVPVTDVVAAVLRHVLAAAARAAGDDSPDALVLTHPDRWAGPRLDALVAAAQHAGVDPSRIRLVSEPVAAATRYAGARSSSHETVAVFDYGGGTCDVAVLRRSEDPARPWDVLASDGADPLGGDGVDHLMLAAVIERLRDSGHDALLEALDAPENLGARLTLRDEVREAKHALSYHEQSEVPVVVRDHQAVVSLTADEFDALVSADVDRAVHLTAATLRRARVDPTALDVLYLTGGSSHMRSVHRELSELLGGRPATLEDPKLVVALGALDVVAVSPSAAAPLPGRAAHGASGTPSGIETPVAPPAGLSPPTQRLLTLYPALAAALARHPEGPAAIDDEPMLVALLCAPGLVEQVTQDPTVLDRVRATGYVVYDLYKVGDGVPRPVQVFFPGNAAWHRHFDSPVTQVGFDEQGTIGWWAVRLVQSWSAASDAERGTIEADPTWSGWRRLDWPEWLASDDDIESVTLDSIDRLDPGRERLPRAFRFDRPFRVSPQQEAVVRALGPLFELREGGSDRLRDLQTLAMRFDGVVEAALRAAYGPSMVRQVINGLKVQNRNFYCGGVFLCAATPVLPAAAVVLPWDDPIQSGSLLTPRYPVILTRDVLRRLKARNNWLGLGQGGTVTEQGKWVVVTTSATEVQMRSADPQGFEHWLRRILLGTP